jgi:Mlc titration factor MtfA (ptsG expression regulator)
VLHCDPYAIETAQATVVANPTFSGKMADADSAPRCIFPQIVERTTRAELLGHIQVFLAEKRFEGCGGFAITDEVRVTIAGASLSAIVAPQNGLFPQPAHDSRLSIVVQGGRKRQIGEHLWEEGTVGRLGETGRRMGSLVLSWGAVKHGAADPSDGKERCSPRICSPARL